jgi:hypothetical protein
MKTIRRRRRGTSLAEAAVAMGVLAVGVGGILQLGTGETRRVAMTRERLKARSELSRMFHALGDRSRQYFEERGLLAAEGASEFSPMHASLLSSHPLLGGEVPDGLQRMILADPNLEDGGVRLTFLVRYQTAGGASREVSAQRVVY